MLVFSQALGFQTCLLSGSLTLVVMNLPTIIRTTQESLKTVPQGYREGAMGAFEDGDFSSAWGIGAVLLILVLVINLAARLAKTKRKQKQ